MTNRKNEIVRTIIFIIIFILLFKLLTNIFNPSGALNEWYESKAITQFYDLKKNSIDVLYMGDSKMYSSVSPYEIYKEKNITGYDLATPGEVCWSTYYILKEALKTQKPKIIFLEANNIAERNRI